MAKMETCPAGGWPALPAKTKDKKTAPFQFKRMAVKAVNKFNFKGFYF